MVENQTINNNNNFEWIMVVNFVSKEFQQFCEVNGIFWQFTLPFTLK
jgi:hypothetical protein